MTKDQQEPSYRCLSFPIAQAGNKLNHFGRLEVSILATPSAPLIPPILSSSLTLNPTTGAPKGSEPTVAPLTVQGGMVRGGK